MILIPYFFSASYGLLTAYKKEGYAASENPTKDIIISIIAVVYSIWLIYAAGIQYFLLSALLYVPGVIFYIMARKESNAEIFTTVEKIIFSIAVLAALFAAFSLYKGTLSI